jgi:hypothetical protein
MLYALAWFVVLLLVGLWSLTTWALHAVAVWVVTQAGALTGGVTGWEGPVLPDWLAVWMPAEWLQGLGAMLASMAPLVESLLQSMPSLAGLLTVAAWVIWALGSALLVLVGAGVHLALALWRRRHAGPTVPPHRALTAG